METNLNKIMQWNIMALRKYYKLLMFKKIIFNFVRSVLLSYNL